MARIRYRIDFPRCRMYTWGLQRPLISRDMTPRGTAFRQLADHGAGSAGLSRVWVAPESPLPMFLMHLL